jgi:hypothetical protein
VIVAGVAVFATVTAGAGGAGGATQAALSAVVNSDDAVATLLYRPVPGPEQADAAVYVSNRKSTVTS